jgi:hypothetical protein
LQIGKLSIAAYLDPIPPGGYYRTDLETETFIKLVVVDVVVIVVCLGGARVSGRSVSEVFGY